MVEDIKMMLDMLGSNTMGNSDTYVDASWMRFAHVNADWLSASPQSNRSMSYWKKVSIFSWSCLYYQC